MKNEIKFGTDGWRAIEGECFNKDNVKKYCKKDLEEDEIESL